MMKIWIAVIIIKDFPMNKISALNNPKEIDMPLNK